MKTLATLAILLFATFARADYVDPGAEITNQVYPRQKVVYELSSTDSAKQKSIFKNIVNHKEATAALDLIVLVHGEAVRLFYSDDFRPLIDKANLVRAGLPELVVLQSQGYAYLVP